MGMLPPPLLKVPDGATEEERLAIGREYMGILRSTTEAAILFPGGKRRLLRLMDDAIVKMEPKNA